MKNTESEEHLPPYHFLYFLLLSRSFLCNQTQLLQIKKEKFQILYKDEQVRRDLAQLISLSTRPLSSESVENAAADPVRWQAKETHSQRNRRRRTTKRLSRGARSISFIAGTIWELKRCLEEKKILIGRWRKNEERERPVSLVLGFRIFFFF